MKNTILYKKYKVLQSINSQKTSRGDNTSPNRIKANAKNDEPPQVRQVCPPESSTQT